MVINNEALGHLHTSPKENVCKFSTGFPDTCLCGIYESERTKS